VRGAIRNFFETKTHYRCDEANDGLSGIRTAEENHCELVFSISTPLPYAISLALISAAIWFAFFYRGRYATHGRRITAFATALAGLCAMLMILVIRVTWHI